MLFLMEPKKYKSMSNNTFNGKRFLLLCKQHFIHNTQFLILSSVVYVGIVFVVLSMVQIMDRDLKPHDPSSFIGFLVISFIIFGLLYVGHSFPAFRAKETTINYLMLPASVLEKYVFEFLSRIGIVFLMLPLLYWIVFHFQGYFFTLFTDKAFLPIGIGIKLKIILPDVEHKLAVYTLASAGILLAFVLPLTGATIFNKQPLIKTLFSLILIVLFYILYSYIVVVHFGVKNYNPLDNMWLIPMDELRILQWISGVLIVAIAVMLFVGYRKLKEKEV